VLCIVDNTKCLGLASDIFFAVPAQSSKRDPPSDLVPAPFGISPIIFFLSSWSYRTLVIFNFIIAVDDKGRAKEV